jgi:hypothetical protein
MGVLPRWVFYLSIRLPLLVFYCTRPFASLRVAGRTKASVPTLGFHAYLADSAYYVV